MLAAIERMPEDWEEIEPCWYLARRAEMFSTHHFGNRIRRKTLGRRYALLLRAHAHITGVSPSSV